MMSRASERTMARRKAHGPEQARRKTEALTESRAAAKAQRKGPKGVESQMKRRGYVSEFVSRKVRLTGGRIETVRFHVWRKAVA
jgi:hypothetical protein